MEQLIDEGKMTLGSILQAKLALSKTDPEPVTQIDLKAFSEREEKRGKVISTTSYSALSLSAHKFRILVDHLASYAVILAKALEAEAIAVRGTSGYSVAFAMRMLTSFPIVVARKSGESSHGPSISLVDNGEGETISRYLILDDLVDSGTTVKQMIRDLKPAVCVGILEYYEVMEALMDGDIAHLCPKLKDDKVSGVSRYGYAF